MTDKPLSKVSEGISFFSGYWNDNWLISFCIFFEFIFKFMFFSCSISLLYSVLLISNQGGVKAIIYLKISYSKQNTCNSNNVSTMQSLSLISFLLLIHLFSGATLAPQTSYGVCSGCVIDAVQLASVKPSSVGDDEAEDAVAD